jgi:hypothetical protein
MNPMVWQLATSALAFIHTSPVVAGEPRIEPPSPGTAIRTVVRKRPVFKEFAVENGSKATVPR